MKCTACGADLVEGAKFCEYCGTPVAAAPALEPAQADAPKAAPTLEIPPAPKAPEPEVASAPAQEQTYTYQQPQNQAPSQPQNQAYGQPYTPPAAPQPEALTPKCKTFGIISFILGLWSTVFCWLSVIPAAGIGLGFFMVASAIVGLIFSGISRKEGNFKLAKLGKVFSIIGLVLSAILWIVGIIITAAAASRGYFRNYY